MTWEANRIESRWEHPDCKASSRSLRVLSLRLSGWESRLISQCKPLKIQPQSLWRDDRIDMKPSSKSLQFASWVKCRYTMYFSLNCNTMGCIPWSEVTREPSDHQRDTSFVGVLCYLQQSMSAVTREACWMPIGYIFFFMLEKRRHRRSGPGRGDGQPSVVHEPTPLPIFFSPFNSSVASMNTRLFISSHIHSVYAILADTSSSQHLFFLIRSVVELRHMEIQRKGPVMGEPFCLSKVFSSSFFYFFTWSTKCPFLPTG